MGIKIHLKFLVLKKMVWQKNC